MAVKQLTSVTPGVTPPAQAGRARHLAVNIADAKVWIFDEAGTPVELSAIRPFRATAKYAANDLIIQGGVIYRASQASGPAAFAGANFTTLFAVTAFPASTAPGNPNQQGVWYDTGAKMLMVWNGTAWVRALDTRVAVAGTAPTSPATGDLWYDTSVLGLKVWNGTAWAVTTRTSAVTGTAPTGPYEGQIWYDTSTATLKIRVASAWAAISGGGGGGGTTVTVSTSAPATSVAGDLWANQETGQLSVRVGSAWENASTARWRAGGVGVLRSWNDRLRTLGFDPEDFGALGDSFNDDTSALKLWAAYGVTKGGAALRVPPKQYRTTLDSRMLLPLATSAGNIWGPSGEVPLTRVPFPQMGFWSLVDAYDTTFDRPNQAFLPKLDGSYSQVTAQTRRVEPTRGVLIEGSGTNKLTYALKPTSWTKYQVTAAAALGATGLLDGVLITTSVAAQSCCLLQVFTADAAAKHTFVVALRAAASTGAELALFDKVVNANVAATGRILSGPGAVTGSSKLTITGLSAASWTTVALTTTVNLVNGRDYEADIYPDRANATTLGRAVNAWCPQLEVRDFATSPMGVDTGSTGGRNSEIERRSCAGENFAAQSGLIWFTLRDKGGTDRCLWSCSDATFDNGVRLSLSADLTTLKLLVRVDGADVSSVTVTVTNPVPFARQRVAWSWNASGRLALSLNGAAVVVAQGTPVPLGLTDEYVGKTPLGNFSFCFHELIYRWPGALPDAFLAGLPG